MEFKAWWKQYVPPKRIDMLEKTAEAAFNAGIARATEINSKKIGRVEQQEKTIVTLLAAAQRVLQNEVCLCPTEESCELRELRLVVENAQNGTATRRTGGGT